MSDITVEVVEPLVTVSSTQALVRVDVVGGPPSGIPDGGTTNQILAKASSVDRDVHWISQLINGPAEYIVNGALTIPRFAGVVDSNTPSATPASGVLHLTYFRVGNNVTTTQCKFQTGGTAVVTPTHAWCGLYDVDEVTGDLTRQAMSTDKTTGYTGALANQTVAWTTSYDIVANRMYAFAILQIGTGSASLLGSWTQSQLLGLRPRLAATLSDQSELPATIADSSLSDHQFAVFATLI